MGRIAAALTLLLFSLSAGAGSYLSSRPKTEVCYNLTKAYLNGKFLATFADTFKAETVTAEEKQKLVDHYHATGERPKFLVLDAESTAPKEAIDIIVQMSQKGFEDAKKEMAAGKEVTRDELNEKFDELMNSCMDNPNVPGDNAVRHES